MPNTKPLLRVRFAPTTKRYSADWMNYWWGYELVHQWMLTGHFTWKVPVLGKWLEWRLPEGRPPCDWFGVNYYSRWGDSFCGGGVRALERSARDAGFGGVFERPFQSCARFEFVGLWGFAALPRRRLA
jgi:hypothetical protein